MKMLARRSNSYDAISHAAVRIDERADIIQLNRTALTCSQFESNDLLNRLLHDFFHPSDIT